MRIRSIQGDSVRNIWFGTGSLGLVCLDPLTDTIVKYGVEEGLAHKHARTMKEMSDGRIAVATKGGRKRH